MDKLIRELLIDINQKGGAKASKAVKDISTNLEAAKESAAELNTELQKTPAILSTVNSSVSKTATSLDRMGNSSSVKKLQASLDKLNNQISVLIEANHNLENTMVSGFNNILRTSTKMGNTTNRILERMEDNTITLSRSTRMLSGEYSSLDVASRKAADGLAASTRQARGQARDFAAISSVGGGLPKLYAAIAANVFVLGTAFRQLSEGDKLNRLTEISQALSASSGKSINSMARDLQEATQGALSFEQALQTATKAATTGFDSKQLQQFAVIAKRSSAALGVSFDDALKRVTEGVSRLDSTQVKALGLTTRLDDAYKAYANTLNIKVKDLNSFQRQQAYMNAIVEESSKKFGTLDNVIRATTFEEFGANVEGSLKRLKMAASSNLEPIIDQLNTLLHISKGDKQLQSALDLSLSISSADTKNLGTYVNLYSELRNQQDGIATSAENSKKRLAEVDKELAAISNRTGAYNIIKKGSFGALDIATLTADRLGIISAEQASQLRNLEASSAKYNKLMEERKRILADLSGPSIAAAQGNNLASLQALLEKGGATKEFTEQALAVQKVNDQLVEYDIQLKEINEEIKNYSGDKTRLDYLLLPRQAAITSLKSIMESTYQSMFDSLKSQADANGGIAGAIIGDEKTVLESFKTIENFSRETGDNIRKGLKNLDDFGKVEQAMGTVNGLLEAINKTGIDIKANWDGIASVAGLTSRELTTIVSLQGQLKTLSQAQLAADRAQAEANKKKLEVLQKGGSTEAANVAGAKEQLRIQQEYVNELKSTYKTLQEGSDEQLQKSSLLEKAQDKLVELQIAQYNASSKGTKNQKAFADISERLAIINSRNLDSYEYSLALLKAQLNEEKAKYAQLIKFGKQQNEINSSLLTQATLRRQIDAKENYEAAQRDISFKRTQNSIDSINNKWNDSTIRQEEIKILLQEQAAIIADGTKGLQERLDIELKIAQAMFDQKKAASDRAVANINQGNSAINTSWQTGDPSVLTSEQQTDLQIANSTAIFSEARSALASINSEAVSVGDNIGNLIASFEAMGNGTLTITQGIAQGMQTLASIMSYASSQRISSIDAEIAAEKERDGQSEESKRKIKKLEAQKLAEQKKNALQQIAIQTAVAVMMAAANPWPFPAIPMMAAAAIAGGLAYASASSATLGSAGTSGGDATSYLTLGERQNNIDVSKSANAGEMSYIQGDRGVGSANNFIPRAEGGDMLPGVSYLLGESGPEIATPKVPMKSISNEQLNNNNTPSNVYSINVQAMDASSFLEYLTDNKASLKNALESALNEGGKTLDRL